MAWCFPARSSIWYRDCGNSLLAPRARATLASSRWTPSPRWPRARSLPGWLQASVFRRTALDGRWFNPRLRVAEDLVLIMQVYASGMPVAFLEEVLVEVRRHGSNSYLTGEEIQNAVLAAVLSLEAEAILSTSQQAILRRRIAAEYCALGWRHFWQP